MSTECPAVQIVPQNESRWLAWCSAALLVYVLLAAVGAIEIGFRTATGGNAQQLFAFATHPLVAVLVGMVATALIQSSSTVTSIIVGLVAGGLPIHIAIPLVMGANIGTSLTSTLVSLGSLRNGPEFRRALSAATIHDSFNFLAVALLLPTEMVFHPLERTSAALVQVFRVDLSFSLHDVNFIKRALAPAGDLLQGGTSWLPGIWSGVAQVALGVGLILLVVSALGKILRRIMVGRARQVMQAAVGRGPLTGMGCGAVMTVLVQSSSTTTALIVPMAASEVFTLRQVYPFTLGANVGTTITALLAATAVSGPTASLAMQIALVHLLFNVFGILLIYGLPVFRGLPVQMAENLAALAQRNSLYVLAYIGGAFFALPLLLLGLMQLF